MLEGTVGEQIFGCFAITTDEKSDFKTGEKIVVLSEGEYKALSYFNTLYNNQQAFVDLLKDVENGERRF